MKTKSMAVDGLLLSIVASGLGIAIAAAWAGTSTIPEVLAPASGEALAMSVGARGAQLYECRARRIGSAVTGYEWTFVAPEAELFDAAGHSVGIHGAGPMWQASDGSKVFATLKARADAPERNAIPWLLLVARNAGPDGAFSRVTSIQRVNTRGGVAPDEGCRYDSVGAKARVPYTADYIFYTAG